MHLLIFFSLFIFNTFNVFGNGFNQNEKAWDLLNKEHDASQALILFKQSYKKEKNPNSLDGIIWSYITLGKGKMALKYASIFKKNKREGSLLKYLVIIQFIYESRYEVIEIANKFIKSGTEQEKKIAYIAKARALIFNGQFDLAKRSVYLAKGKKSWNKELVSAFISAEVYSDPERAFRIYKQNKKEYSPNEGIYFEVAKKYYEQGYLKLADKMVDQINKVNPSNAEAWGLKSLISWKDGKGSIARKHALHSVTLNRRSYLGNIAINSTNRGEVSLHYDNDTEKITIDNMTSEVERVAPTFHFSWNFAHSTRLKLGVQKTQYKLSENDSYEFTRAFLQTYYAYNDILINGHVGQRFSSPNITNKSFYNVKLNYIGFSRFSFHIGKEEFLASEKVIDNTYDSFQLSFGSNGISGNALTQGLTFKRDYLGFWTDLRFLTMYLEYGQGETSDFNTRRTFNVSSVINLAQFSHLLDFMKIGVNYLSFGFNKESPDYYSPSTFSLVNPYINIEFQPFDNINFKFISGPNFVQGGDSGWSHHAESVINVGKLNIFNFKYTNGKDSIYASDKFTLGYARKF